MSNEISGSIGDSVESLGDEALQSIVNCAVAIGCADGQLDTSERRELGQHLLTVLGGDKAAVRGYIDAAIEAVDEWDAGSLYEQAYELLDEDGCETCFIIAAAVGGKSGGTNIAEGVALQALANALGIEAMTPRYFKLLAQGQAMARS